MKWFVTYENNDKCIFSQKADTREAACNIAFDKLKELTENYRKRGVQYKWTDKGNEICVETDTETHCFSVCSADEYYTPIAFLVLVAMVVALGIFFWVTTALIFWDYVKEAVISYLLILAPPVIFLILDKLYDTDSRKGIARDACIAKQLTITAALWVALLVLVAKFGWLL